MLLLIVLIVSFNIVHSFDVKLDVLTDNFFENLQGDPVLIEQNSLNDNSKRFIQEQIENYINLVTHEKTTPNKKKRSLLDKFTKEFKGTYLLSGALPLATIPVYFPEDIELFYQNVQWYAAALESSNAKEHANSLVIHRYKNETFTEVARKPVSKATQLSVINVKNVTLIAVAENDTVKDDFHEKSGIYQFSDSGLDKIQSMNMEYASDIVMWKIHNEIYLSIAQFMSNKTGNIHYELDIPLYKWMGKHFDQVQTIKGKGTWKITPYTVDHLSFVAVANLRDNQGNTKIYSEIYKYDYHLDNYKLHQRILTTACTDIEFFSFFQNNYGDKEHFLVVANGYEEDSEGNIDYETDSIIYKLVDDYFIPFQTIELNAVEQWLAVNGPNNEVILLAFCRYEGVKVYQFDGWSFTLVAQKASDFFSQIGVKGINVAYFNASQVIVLANKNNKGNVANIFKLNYTFHNGLNEIYGDMMSWCDSGLKRVEALSGGGIFEVVLGKPERADIDEEHFEISTEPELDDLNEDIKNLSKEIDSLRILLQGNNTDLKSVNLSDLKTDHLIFKKDLSVQNLKTTKINGVETNELLENVLDIDNGFELNEITLTSATIEGPLVTQQINNKDPQNLIHRSDDINLHNLNVQGTTNALNGTELHEKLNGITISDENILLTVGNQTFSKPLNLSNMIADQITVESLNGRELTENIPKEQNSTLNRIKHLTVKNLTIGGYINEVYVPTLEKYALRKTGNQEITSDYIFDALEGHNLVIKSEINGKKLSDLIPIDGGNYTIDQDTIFAEDLTVNNLIILDSLNDVHVEKGKLDVLLKDSLEEQEISGDKTFDDLSIHKAIYLQGNIRSDELEKMNPMVTVEKELTLEGNFTILGDVLVEKFLSANDIVTVNGSYSLTKLEAEGMELTEEEIRPHLRFIQQLNLNEVFVNTVNDKDPTNFVVIGSEDTQLIQASKTFLGDLYITGATQAFRINDVNVEELENKVLKMDGDQVIVGKHHVKNVIVDKVSSNSTKFGHYIDFGSNNSSQKTSNMETIHGDFNISIINAKKVFVKGLVNDLNFDEIIKDTASKNADSMITGTKSINNLNVESLQVKEGIVDEMLQETKELKLNDSLKINEIEVENLSFEQQFNKVDRDNFGQDQFDELGNRVVNGDHSFETIVVYKTAYISSDKINHVYMTDLVNNTVKIDEPHEFNSATFESTVISPNQVKLGGAIENFDFENVVFSKFDSEQNIFDEKVFKNNIIVNGTVSFSGQVNAMNFNDFCKFTMAEAESKHLTINGDGIFVKGPNVGFINNVNMSSIWDNAWFGDEDTTLTGYVEFDNVFFQSDIEVKGFVDNVSLKWLSENYFSKSKDQEITATFNFDNTLIFESNVSAPDMSVSGEVNGINLDALVRTILLNNTEQVFETVVYLEECAVENLTGQFTVNDLNIDQDVMRYDKTNMVTGTKSFDDLTVEFLKLEKNIKIQEVDVLDWIKNAALKSTTVNITGTKIIQNANFTSGLELIGKLNGIKFDENNVMLKNIPQNITGKKTIFTHIFDPVKFRTVKLKGSLNGVDISDLIKNQAYKNQENIFTTNLNLSNNITTRNLMIKKSYQGINITELISNITNLGALNNLLEQYKKLRIMSQKLEKSIQAQAYFAHHYKIIQTIPQVTNNMRIVLFDGTTKIGTLATDNTGIIKIHLFGWNKQKKQFVMDSNIYLSNKPLRFVDQVLMGRYLYLESNGFGEFIQMSNLANIITIQTNRTRSSSSFIMPSSGDVCTLFAYFESGPKVYCETSDGIKLIQSLESPNAYEVSSVTIANNLYLIIINEPTNRIDSRTDLWLFNNGTNTFQIHQSLFEAQPKSIATAHYRGFYYLAIASGHLQNAIYSGRVEIRRFDQSTQKFLPFQSLELDAPIQVEFSIFPSDELDLYVLTDNPTEPFLVYRYEGIAGFKLNVVGSTLPRIFYINQFEGAVDQNLIVAQSADEMNVIQAIFKGEKLID